MTFDFDKLSKMLGGYHFHTYWWLCDALSAHMNNQEERSFTGPMVSRGELAWLRALQTLECDIYGEIRSGKAFEGAASNPGDEFAWLTVSDEEKTSWEEAFAMGMEETGLDLVFEEFNRRKANRIELVSTFLAILGAIAVDSCFDMDAVMEAIQSILDTDALFFHNPVIGRRFVLEIKEWSYKKGLGIPCYEYGVIDDAVHCKLTFSCPSDLSYEGVGRDETSARREAARIAYEDLLSKGEIKNPYRAAFPEPKEEEAALELLNLFELGLIGEPVWHIEPEIEMDGKTTYKVALALEEECFRVDMERFETEEEGRNACAYEALLHLEMLDKD